MKHVSIIVPAGDAILSSIVGAYKVFDKANIYLKQFSPRAEPYFKMDLVGITPETKLYDGIFSVRPTKQIEEVSKTDIIIVTTIFGDFEKELERNYPFVEWMREQHLNNKAEIASLCTGAFLLASTGLLDGKSCATHWLAHEAFRANFPKVELMPERIINEANGLYSSGGAYSFLNLLLYLVEKHCGREAAIWCAKILEIEFDRSDQNRFIIFNGQKDHQDEAIKKAQHYIEANYEEKLSVEALANRFAISRRNFVRRFKKATSNTPLEYIQRVKVEAAKKSLESTTKHINEVMYQVGYNDTKAFRTTFRKYTGLSPIEYRSKYNREMVMLN